MGKKQKYGLFEKRKSSKYAEIIKLDSIDNAEKSIKKMEAEFNKAETNSKKRGIIRRLNSASNIATVMNKNKNLSSNVRKEKGEISSLYRESQKKLSEKYKKSKK